MLCFLQASGFCLPITAIEGRLGVMLTLVLTQLAFKFAIMDLLPRVHYLSNMDKYMMFTMFCSMVVAAEHVFVIPFLDPDAAAQIDAIAIVLLIIMLLVSALAFFTVNQSLLPGLKANLVFAGSLLNSNNMRYTIL